MESENARIKSKASVICNNVESGLITVRLKGLQILIECNKIYWDESFFKLSYGTKE